MKLFKMNLFSTSKGINLNLRMKVIILNKILIFVGKFVAKFIEKYSCKKMLNI